MGWDTIPWLPISLWLGYQFMHSWLHPIEIGCDVQNIIVVSNCSASEDTENDWMLSNKKKKKRREKVEGVSAMLYKKSKTLQIYKYGFFYVHYFMQVFNLQFLNFKFKPPRLSSWSTIIQNQMSVNTFYMHNLFSGIQAKILEEKNILTVVLFFFLITKTKLSGKFCKYIWLFYWLPLTNSVVILCTQ